MLGQRAGERIPAPPILTSMAIALVLFGLEESRDTS